MAETHSRHWTTMISDLFHVGARTNHSTIVTQEVQARREPDLCSKNADPGSSLPAKACIPYLLDLFTPKI